MHSTASLFYGDHQIERSLILDVMYDTLMAWVSEHPILVFAGFLGPVAVWFWFCLVPPAQPYEEEPDAPAPPDPPKVRRSVLYGVPIAWVAPGLLILAPMVATWEHPADVHVRALDGRDRLQIVTASQLQRGTFASGSKKLRPADPESADALARYLAFISRN